MDFKTPPPGTSNLAMNTIIQEEVDMIRTGIHGNSRNQVKLDPPLSQSMFTCYQSSSSSNNSPAPTEHSLLSEGFDSDSLPSQNLQDDLCWSPRNNSASPSLSTGSNSSGGSSKKKKGAPYIPSYMDVSNGPEPCVVCGDAATGYHYRCMTCEGCKGFFRRTVQKNLRSTYQCKWSNQCAVDKTSRNNCQECRFKKCIAVGMAPDLVLNDKQRIAKRKLIQENRDKRKHEILHVQMKHTSCDVEVFTDADKNLIEEIESAYNTLMARSNSNQDVNVVQNGETDVWNHLSAAVTPFVVKLIHFAKKVPGFLELDLYNQLILLKASCMEVLCLRVATSYNPNNDCLCFSTGATLSKETLMANTGLECLLEPLLEFSAGLHRLKLDEAEVALLATVLMMQSDRAGLSSPDLVEQHQDSILGVYKRYIAKKRPTQPVHWAKVLMKVTDLRTIASRYGDRVLGIKLDNPEKIPPLFLDMFEGPSSL